MDHLDLIKIEIKEEILFFEYLSDKEINLEMAQAFLEERLKYTQERNRKIISSFPLIKGITKEARDFLGGQHAKEGLLAVAVVGSSSVANMIANIFFTFNLKRGKGDPPIKFFREMENAFSWLKELDV